MNLLWIDLEMSGLDVSTCRILEVAAIVTDLQFNELDSYHAIVKQDPAVLEAMDEWCTRQHGASGLSAAVPTGTPEEQVEDELIEFVGRYFKRNDRPILCGNSIGTDREFIRAWWPRLARKLHYRLLDVSSYKVIFKERYGVEFKKQGSHRAIGDIRESIAELQHYLSFLDTARLPISQ